MVTRFKLFQRLKRYLEERGGCAEFHRLLADLRATPSELKDLIFELESQGRLFFDGERVCLLSSEVLEALESDVARELRALLRREGYEVVVAPVKGLDLLALPTKPLLVRGKNYSFAFRVVAGRVPPGRLAAAAREAAKGARTLAGRWRDLVGGRTPPETIIPMVVIKRGAFQLVEGVVVLPLVKVRDFVADPSPILASPLTRYYKVGEGQL